MACQKVCSGTISGLVAEAFCQVERALVGRPECSLMSGCGWGHEPKEIVSKKL